MGYSQVALILAYSNTGGAPLGPIAPSGNYRAADAVDAIRADVETTVQEELGGLLTGYVEADVEEAREAAAAWLISHSDGTPIAVELYVAEQYAIGGLPGLDLTRVYYGDGPGSHDAAAMVASKLHDLGIAWTIDIAHDPTLRSDICHIKIGVGNIAGAFGRSYLGNPSWRALIGAQIADGVLAYAVIPEE